MAIIIRWCRVCQTRISRNVSNWFHIFICTIASFLECIQHVTYVSTGMAYINARRSCVAISTITTLINSGKNSFEFNCCCAKWCWFCCALLIDESTFASSSIVMTTINGDWWAMDMVTPDSNDFIAFSNIFSNWALIWGENLSARYDCNVELLMVEHSSPHRYIAIAIAIQRWWYVKIKKKCHWMIKAINIKEYLT